MVWTPKPWRIAWVCGWTHRLEHPASVKPRRSLRQDNICSGPSFLIGLRPMPGTPSRRWRPQPGLDLNKRRRCSAMRCPCPTRVLWRTCNICWWRRKRSARKRVHGRSGPNSSKQVKRPLWKKPLTNLNKRCSRQVLCRPKRRHLSRPPAKQPKKACPGSNRRSTNCEHARPKGMRPSNNWPGCQDSWPKPRHPLRSVRAS